MFDETYTLALWDSPPRTDIEVTTRTRSVVPDSTIRDKAVGHVYGSDDSALPPLGRDLEDFGHWSSVASTLYNKLYQISRFDPSGVEYSARPFANLWNSFSTSPFWNSQLSIASRNVTLRHEDYQEVVRTIEDLCHRIDVEADIQRSIVRNVKRIAQLASEPDEVVQKQSLFCNAAIAIAEENLNIIFMYAVVPLEMDQIKGRYRVITKDMEVTLGRGVLNFGFCKRHASNILGYDKKSVEAWQSQAAANSQPENTSEGWPPDPLPPA